MEVRRGYKRTDVGIFPEDWVVRTVGSMGEVRAGKALAAKGPGRPRLYIRTKNVFDGRIVLDDVLEMPMTDADFSRYRLRYGDVLLNEGQSIELVGRCAMYRGEYAEPCAIQNQLVRFRAHDGVSADFAAHLFRYCQVTGAFSRIAMQTTSVAHLGVSRFKQLDLAWPREYREQEAIADALSDADTLIETLEQLVTKKRQIKHGAMQELLTGQKRLPGFATSSGYKPTEVGVIPEDWVLRRVAELVRQGPKNGYSGRSGSDVSGTPTLSLSATTSGRLVLNQETVKYLEERIASDSDLFLREDDVLVQRSNTIELVGTTAIFTGPNNTYVYPDLMMRLRFRDRIPAHWFWRHANSSAGRNYFMSVAAGSTGTMPKLSGDKLRNMPIPLPPTKAEQEAIAALLSDMDAEIAALEAKLAKARQVKQGMMQELLTGRIRLV